VKRKVEQAWLMKRTQRIGWWRAGDCRPVYAFVAMTRIYHSDAGYYQRQEFIERQTHGSSVTSNAPGRVGLSGSGISDGPSIMNAGGNVGLRNGGRVVSLCFYLVSQEANISLLLSGQTLISNSCTSATRFVDVLVRVSMIGFASGCKSLS